jgi:hypothetical protein
MFHILQSPETNNNDEIEGFGARYDDPSFPIDATYPGILGGSHKVVMFRLLSGVFNQEKFLPIRYMPISIEMELVSTPNDPILYPSDIATAVVAGVPFNTTNSSIAWHIEDVQLKCDLCTLDNALDNEYAQHLLSGKSLPINYNTYISQSQQMIGQNLAVNVTRALTRLKSVFLSMDKARTGEGMQGSGITYKSWNDFFHSMGGNITDPNQIYDPTKEMEFQIQIGSKLFPEYPMRSVAEVFYQLRKTLGIHTSSFYNVDIRMWEYINRKFIVGVDTEKVLAAGFTGLNTKAGDLMTIKVKQLTLDPLSLADKMFIVLHADMILNIRDTGVEVLE